MNILILSPYPPYPPYGGGTMRIYQMVRGLAARHTVTCLTFAPDEAAEQQLAPLQRICRVVTVRGPASRSLLQRASTTIGSPLPDMAHRNASDTFRAVCAALLDQEQIDVVLAESIEMASHLPFAHPRRPFCVLDQFNAEYILQRRAATTSLGALRRPGTPARAGRNLAGGVYSLAQWAKLYRYERQVMRQCDAVLAVSEDDRAVLAKMAATTPVLVVPNGVDTGLFSRAALAAEGVAPLGFGPPTVLFSGTLDFRPNVDAIHWFADTVLPRIRLVHHNVQFVLVGKRPHPSLRALAERGDAVLVGQVDDTRPYIAGGHVYAVPMRIGGGVRLKLLEAFALEAPTVSTTMGAEGVSGLQHDVHCLLADTPSAFAAATLRLLDDRAHGARLGRAARTLVGQSYDWSQIIGQLDAELRTRVPHPSSR